MTQRRFFIVLFFLCAVAVSFAQQRHSFGPNRPMCNADNPCTPTVPPSQCPTPGCGYFNR